MAVILLVDDDKPVLDMIVMTLSTFAKEHKVIAVTDPLKAIDECEDLIPDLLITDVQMPNLKGTELAVLVRAAYPNVKVLYISGFDGGLVDEQVENIIYKPFRLNEFVIAVNSLLKEEFRC